MVVVCKSLCALRIPRGDVCHLWETDDESHVAVCDIVDLRHERTAGSEVNWVFLGSIVVS